MAIQSEKNIHYYYKNNNFIFSKDVIACYLLSLMTKPFIILSGISGTGKTKIAQLFARYICQEDEEETAKKRLAFVSVRPDWMDNKGLLGYYNMLDEKYHATPVLELLLDAADDSERPYFVILDEMNLAKVEHYFSDFLSIMESRTHDNLAGETIRLHPLEMTETHDGRIIPGAIHIPANVFFAGTVNVDESTYMFSPKVLDRANVIEFNEVDLDGYGQNFAPERKPLVLRNAEVLNVFYQPGKKPFCSKEDYDALPQEGKNIIKELLTVLLQDNLHFGYRVANEMARFINLAREELADFSLDQVMDVQILQKILPKLHGTRAKLEDPLARLFAFCHVTHDDAAPEELLAKARSYDPEARFPRSAQKIARMMRQLFLQGYASFIE